MTEGPAPPPRLPEPRDAPSPPRRGRVPVPPSGQQGLAQVRTQLPQRRLLLRYLQRPCPLLKPHSQLHGGSGRARVLDPEAATVTVRPNSFYFKRRRPRSGDSRSRRVKGVLRNNGEKAPPRRPSCRPVSRTRALRPCLEGALCSPPRERRLTARSEAGGSGTCDRRLGAPRRRLGARRAGRTSADAAVGRGVATPQSP